ncbi:MAG: membrane protein insertase YidC [Flammeovirgaceae bacterium]|nr:membrane protein insertase YidC [Flammeovirgaceae bacterium]
MDRNSAIGLTLIAVLLLGYFYFFSPTPQPAPQQVVETTTQPGDSTSAKPVATVDSARLTALGNLSTYLQGNESATTIETEDLKVTFSNKGGVIKSLELKNHKTYSKESLTLVNPTTTFNLFGKVNHEDLDLYSLFYVTDKREDGDTIRLSFSIQSPELTFKQIYSIPKQGYEITYRLQGADLKKQISGDVLRFEWKDFLKPIEKDLTDTRNNTTITYYSKNNGFDELNARSTDIENEVFAEPVNWVTIKEKYFLSSLISQKGFSGGEVETGVNASDDTVVKRTSVKLFIPVSDVASGVSLKYYFGPNDYYNIDHVAESFEENVYLGWPPVKWVNQFFTLPIFHQLGKFIGNYGLIIILMVIIIRIVLLPLSYKSYLSMAKMRVLKPELDEIKEKHGEDMTKVQQEQLKLYQQVGVNPISGCIPLLLQMPILFAMLYLFPNSIDLRQESFLWADDLSTYDSIMNLPFTIPFYGSHVSLFTLLMTASTLVITWQNNQMTTVQGPMKSLGYIMPVVFMFVLNTFPSGLSFYYLMANIVTFIQQAVIKRFVDEGKIKAIMEENRKKNANGGGKKSKFMARLEEAMKNSEQARKSAEEERKKKKSK